MRPAFYALAPGGWRDYVTLIHLPSRLWHLSYVVIGACLAPHVPGWRLVLTVVAFFLGLGVGAHALDELNGRPLQTRIPTGVLIALAAGSTGRRIRDRNCGRRHARPVVAGVRRLRRLHRRRVQPRAFRRPVPQPLLAGGGLGRVSGSDRLLRDGGPDHGRGRPHSPVRCVADPRAAGASTPVRDVRRRTISVTGTIERRDGTLIPIGPETLTGPPETALRFMAAASVSLAAAPLVLRFV